MDNSLFEKYKKTIIKQNSEKEKIINIIKEKTGIILKEKQIVLEDNKKIKLFITSVQKNTLKLKNISEYLKEEGFIID